MSTYRIFQAIVIPHTALISVIFGLMILSFPIGAYLFFNSQMGKSIDYALPITELGLVKRLNMDWLAQIGIGDIFIAVWVTFLILFVIGSMGPKKSFLKALSPIMVGSYESLAGNYIVQSIKWFSIIIVLSAAIDIVQQNIGIKITAPTFENDLTGFLGLSISPLIEEIGFRVILIGVPLFFLYSKKFSVGLFFKSLWNPLDNIPNINQKKALIVIILVGVFFGVAHILGEQWSSGKATQAAMAGIIIGWVYYRYGFVAGVLIHWATNYMIYSYAYLVSTINEIGITESFSHSLIGTIEVILVLAGISGLALTILEIKISKDVKNSLS